MLRQLLNRLFGRTDSSIDAINAYVEGNASTNEIKLVEQMMRSNPMLEKDLATQKALLSVLGKIDKVEAPRSFAVTPEMVAAAESSESGIFKLAELFAPQRKLAMAPAILAGFAALAVALLTIGDIAGVVEQSGESDSFATSALQAEAAAAPMAGAPGSPGNPGEPGNLGDAGSPVSPQLEMAVESDDADGSAGVGSSGAAAATAKPAALAPTATLAGAIAAPDMDSLAQGSEAGEALDEPPSLIAPAPAEKSLPETSSIETTIDADGPAAEINGLDDTARELDLAEAVEEADSTVFGSFATDESASTPGETVATFPLTGAAGDDDGIKLPLWQLQIALAALALAVIGAWAGLRRVRRD